MDLKDRTLKLTPKQTEKMAALSLRTAEDILSYYPSRYDTLNAEEYQTWTVRGKVAFEGEVVSAVRSFRFGKNRTVCSFDVSAFGRILHVSIFNRPWAKNLALNQIVTIQGIYNGKDKVTALSYQEKPMAEISAVTPVYSVRSGITQRDVRSVIAKVLNALSGKIEDLIPERLIRSYRLLHREDALRKVHMPESEDDVRSAYRTLKYEEFLIFFLSLQMAREENTAGGKQPKQFDQKKLEAMIGTLPYRMTPDQMRGLQDILLDMTSAKPMYRLLQGDVGCGKTLVAALAMYACVLSGYQASLLAPTEILAVQHEESLRRLLGCTGIRIASLYAGMSRKEQEEVLAGLKEGKIDLLAGTHSLFQERVEFCRLGLVVADEQHRFGVEQRRRFRAKGSDADFLLMSATPIPRTLASTLYGDMDISTIETMPPGRKPVRTVAVHENSFRSVLPDVMKLLEEGRQLYVICAAVDKNEEYDARNVHETAENLKKLFGEKYPVGVLHGRMSSEAKQEVMKSFEAGETKVLVSTTVIEVGVNVINATGMIIYDADRFGMSQIHQLRGRVQRGSSQGYCWLLSSSQEEKALERMKILQSTTSGFEISWQDLRLRGPGDILGTRQSGVPDFILGNPVEDTRIIAQARKDAELIHGSDDPDSAKLRTYVRLRREEGEIPDRG